MVTAWGGATEEVAGGAAVPLCEAESPFGMSWDGDARARDGAGQTWQVTEDGLLGPGGAALKRLPAHRAFWFGWYAAYPATRLVK